MPTRFPDRRTAGQELAHRLARYAGRNDVVVLALPRGGIPVALEIALFLRAPLDVFVVRKLGVPGHEELAMGAIASGGIRVLNEEVRRGLGITNEVIAKVAARELKELNRREASYRGDRPALDVAGRIGILVDDGLATGATMRAAIAALKGSRPSRIIVAVPVGAPTTCEELADVADEVICARSPEAMTAISVWYDDFTQTSDDEVRELLAKAAAETDAGSFATHGRRST